jgi:hypothetical protein
MGILRTSDDRVSCMHSRACRWPPAHVRFCDVKETRTFKRVEALLVPARRARRALLLIVAFVALQKTPQPST